MIIRKMITLDEEDYKLFIEEMKKRNEKNFSSFVRSMVKKAIRYKDWEVK